MNWIALTQKEQLDSIKNDNSNDAILIFKHSTRCSISSMALNRLERSWKTNEIKINTYFLDLISYRELSSQIEKDFGVYHESPQLIIVKNGKAIYDASHMAISYDDIKKNI